MNKDSVTSALSRFILTAHRLSEKSHQNQDRHLYERLIARAGIILAKIVHDDGVRDDIQLVEHFFGNTWLKDDNEYAEVYSAWAGFTHLYGESASKTNDEEHVKENK